METEESKVLEQFRNRVKDLNRTDGTLRRFLKARNYNQNNAEVMLRNSIQWRKENDIDNALNWKVNEEVAKKFPFEFTGVDYQNRPVLFAQMGTWPVREVIEAGQKEDMVRIVYLEIERAIHKLAVNAEQCTSIIDLANMSYWKFIHYETLQHITNLFRTFETNYPERLAEVYIINAPYFFSYLWSIFKPFITGSTLSKITVFGSDNTKYMATLSEKIPPASLPVCLRKLLK